MRIIAGEFRSRTLKAPDTDKTRPTTDRARETLFNVLTNLIDFDGMRVLDLFAGSGALGLEAMSRGAATVTFVEQDRKAVAALNANIHALGVAARTRVIPSDVYRFIGSMTTSWDLILADPPYEDERARLEILGGIAPTMAPEAILAIEHRSGDTVTVPSTLEVLRELKAGEAGFTIVRLKQ